MIDDSSVFAVLPEARRNWVVASILGEAHVHAQLSHRVQPEDNLIYLVNSLRLMAAAALADRSSQPASTARAASST